MSYVVHDAIVALPGDRLTIFGCVSFNAAACGVAAALSIKTRHFSWMVMQEPSIANLTRNPCRKAVATPGHPSLVLYERQAKEA